MTYHSHQRVHDLYEPMDSALTLMARQYPPEVTDALVQVTDLVRASGCLDQLTADDARIVGVTLLFDLSLRGIDGLWWRAEVMHHVSDGFFDNPRDAIAAHAHAATVILTPDEIED